MPQFIMSQKGAISYAKAHPNGCPMASENMEWDGPKEIAAASADDLYTMCAWMDSSEDEESKDTYKLPHHKAAGQHAVVLKGVVAAMAALNGSRGGVSIPSADRRGVYNHLAKHYREFDREPPELKVLSTDDDVLTVSTKFVGSTDVDYVTKEGKKVKGLSIHGFASTNNVDRHGDKIDPEKFDLSTLRNNGQLWVNHTLWNKNGNGISVGHVDEVHPVKVIPGNAENVFNLISLEDGTTIREGMTAEQFPGIKQNLKGLYVEVTVIEPEVIDLVKTKRLNSFSWQGIIKRSPNGSIKSIDVFEVSLVNVPANQTALFQVGKSFQITMDDGNCFTVDLEAVNALVKQENIQTSRMTIDEVLAVSKPVNTPVASASGKTQTKGDIPMEELLKQLEQMKAAFSDKLASLEGKLDAATAEKKGDGTATEAAGDATEVKPKTEIDEKATGPTETEKALAAAVSSIADKVGSGLESVGKQMGAFSVALAGITDRISKLESRPAEKKEVGEESKDNESSETMEKIRKSVETKLADLPPEERRRVTRNALASFLIPTVETADKEE